MDTTDEELRRGGATWLSYGLLGYYAFMLNVLGPVLPFLRAEHGLSATLSSLHASMLAVGMLLASLLSPYVIARLGRQGALWLGGSAMTAASILLTLSGHPAGTLLSALAMGTLGTLLLVVISAQLADSHPAHRATVISEANVGGSIGAALAPLLVGLCGALAVGWRGAVLLGAASFALLAFGLARLRPATAGTQAPAPSAAATRASLPRRFWRYWAVLVLVVAVEFALVFWVASFLVSVRGWEPAAAVIASTTFPALMALGRAVGAAVTRRAAPVPLLYASLGLALVGVLLIWASPLPIATLAGLALAGAGVANLYPLTVAQALAVAPGQSDLASARAALASGSAILTAPLLLGALADWAGLARSFALVPGLIVVAFALLAYATRAQAPAPQAGAVLMEGHKG